MDGASFPRLSASDLPALKVSQLRLGRIGVVLESIRSEVCVQTESKDESYMEMERDREAGPG